MYSRGYPYLSNQFYVSWIKEGNVSIIDADNDTIVKHIPGDGILGSLVYNPHNGFVYVSKRRDDKYYVTIIDLNSDRIVANVQINENVIKMIFNPVDNKIYGVTKTHIFVLDNNIPNPSIIEIPLDETEFYDPPTIVVNPVINKKYFLRGSTVLVLEPNGELISRQFDIDIDDVETLELMAFNPTDNLTYIFGRRRNGTFDDQYYLYGLDVMNRVETRYFIKKYTCPDVFPCSTLKEMAYNPLNNQMYMISSQKQGNVYLSILKNDELISDYPIAESLYWHNKVKIKVNPDLGDTYIFTAMHGVNNKMVVIDRLSNEIKASIAIGATNSFLQYANNKFYLNVPLDYKIIVISCTNNSIINEIPY